MASHLHDSFSLVRTARLWVATSGLVLASSLAQGQESAPLVADHAALDVHTHVASQVLTDLFTGGGTPNVGADDLVARLDEAHVDRAVILSAGYFGKTVGLVDDVNMRQENDFVAAEIARYPDRLIGFCGINPLYPGAPAEVDRCLDLPGMAGVKLHLEGSGVELTIPEDAAALGAVFDRIAARDAPVMIHVSGPTGLPLEGAGFDALGQILNAHPSVRVAHAHCAGNTDDDSIDLWLRVGQSGYNPETSFVDVSACLGYYADAPMAQRELMVWRLRKWGIGHVLFGSDYFAFFGDTPQETLEILTKFPFTQAELDTILSNDGSAWLGR
ncbi:MAG: amidohydrolase family protein [Rhodobacteraceae bacterium]|nr:amidohydrolase family protein [Paracoccaceae bacterium]